MPVSADEQVWAQTTERLNSAARTLSIDQDAGLPPLPHQNRTKTSSEAAGNSHAADSAAPHKRQPSTAERTHSYETATARQRLDGASDDAVPAADASARPSKGGPAIPEVAGATDAADAAPAPTPPRSSNNPEPQPPAPRRVPGPILYLGAAQAQGLRDTFEDRYTLQPHFTPGPPLQPDGQPYGEGADVPAAAAGLNCSFAAVYDGHSAADAAQAAADRLHTLLAGELGACHSADGGFDATAVEAALHRTFAAMDFEILAQSARTGSRGGSTACVALQLGADLFVAHAGDSIAVLDREGGAVKLTAASDHKVEDPQETARIKAKGGTIIPGAQSQRVVSQDGRHSLAMSRALGDAAYKQPHRVVSSQPDVSHTVLGDKDAAVIIASDGLWDVVKTSEAVSIMSASLGGNTELKAQASGHAAEDLAHAAANALVNAAVRRGTADNVTAVVGLVRW